MAQPKPAHNALFAELNDLANDAHASEFQFASFRRNVEKIRNTDLYSYRILMGALEAQQGNLDESEKQHELALELMYNAQALSNYALSMQKFGYFAKASELNKEAVRLEPEVIGHWKSLVLTQLFSGDIVGSHRTLKSLLLKAPGAFEGDSMKEIIAKGARLVEDRTASTGELMSISKLAVDCARRVNARIFDTFVASNEDTDSSWLTFVWSVSNFDAPQIVDLNSAVADALVDSDISSVGLTSLVVRFAPQHADNPI